MPRAHFQQSGQVERRADPREGQLLGCCTDLGRSRGSVHGNPFVVGPFRIGSHVAPIDPECPGAASEIGADEERRAALAGGAGQRWREWLSLQRRIGCEVG